MSDSTKLDPHAAFEKLGQITRQLHQAMSELGLDSHLHRIANEIPDARERLSYVAQMTETAAHKVLGLVDVAQPACASLREQATAQRSALTPLLAGTDGPLRQGLEGALALADAAEQTAEQQHGVLTEIMMSQDFQDLSGQVIKKVIDIISQTETQLLQLLSQSAPEHLAEAAAAASEQLQGPQTPEKALKQDDVDDLLSSLGF